MIIEDAVSCQSLESRQYDAIVTDKPGVAIGIKTADCAPVLLFDRQRKIIAAVHAGWRGTALGIAGKAVRVMAGRFRSRPQDPRPSSARASGPAATKSTNPFSKRSLQAGKRTGCFAREEGKGAGCSTCRLQTGSSSRRKGLSRGGFPPPECAPAAGRISSSHTGATGQRRGDT